MSDPLTFPSTTPRFGLPFLFAAQAQKEITVNELAARLDTLVSCTIEASLAAPPSSPLDGQTWLVASGATGMWAGQAGKLAARIGGSWVFLSPPPGMVVHDLARGAVRRFAGTWQAPARPPGPSGGATIDTEARVAIAAILGVLDSLGLIPPA
jgi:Protein of unknown function (DUF2793)